jgi:DNA-directed RNA polymerase specialized sigma24 family protein
MPRLAALMTAAGSFWRRKTRNQFISTGSTQGRCMARGRKTSLTIHLTPAERRTLLAWQRATTIPAGLARRGRIILLLADGMTITDIATIVGISRRFVYNWVQRFLAEGVEGLADKPGRGRRRGRGLPSVSDHPNNLHVG